MKRFLAEWERQKAILMSFPHMRSDWAMHIQEARECFMRIIETILRYESVVLCMDSDDNEGREMLFEHFQKRVMLCQTSEDFLQSYKNNILFIVITHTNDTWSRDFGGISIEEGGEIKLLDFQFNGWGLKFAANFDNQITRQVLKKIFPHTHIQSMDMVLEGGSIETNGCGTLLTNTQCLLESNRNPHLNQAQIETKLKQYFGLNLVHWLHHGYLAGDDTDSHIDTLARFISTDTIAYIACEDKGDEHFEQLMLMQEELQALRQANGRPYHLIKLPFTRAIYDESGQRLPASYANFLFVNNALLVPTYEDSNDDIALAILRKALPHLEVVGVPCSTLILWHGSLHCISMQLY